MSKLRHALILSGVGGLYTVRTESGETLSCRAKGTFRHEGITPLVGDRVGVRLAEREGEESFIEEIEKRENSLIRPPMANLDTLFVTFAPKHPEPSTLYLDKLLSIAVYQKIRPCVVITKRDIAPEAAEHFAAIYKSAGFDTFLTSAETGDGIAELSAYLAKIRGICAFAGASGVGKSTLLNALFPSLSLGTGGLSEKIARGRHTTRQVMLYPMSELRAGVGYVADTPGFSMLDFIAFDFYTLEDLPHCFPEFEKYLPECRYTDCTHTKEEECGITRAVLCGEIPPERHASYLSLYADLAAKNPWKKP